MDKIWYRNPSKSDVIGGDEQTRMTTQNRQKSNAKKKQKNTHPIYMVWKSLEYYHLTYKWSSTSNDNAIYE